MQKRRWGVGTTAVHAGEVIDPFTGDVTTPIHQSSTYAYPERPTPNGWTANEWIYTRYANPTTAAAEAKVAALEGAEGCLAFASGMAAGAACVLPFVRAGDHVVAMAAIYGGTQALLARQVRRLGMRVDTTLDLEAGAIADLATDKTRVVVAELPTNPFNRLIDLPVLVRRLRFRWGRAAPLTAVDATFATPLNLRPLEHGAALSFHSATKYLNGHTDLIGGVVSGFAKRLEALHVWRRDVGACMDPHQAFLLQRGLKTLEVRLRRAEANARAVSEALEHHRKVKTVWFLGSKAHPDYALGRRLLKGPGAIVTLELRRGGLSAARRFQRGLELFAPAPSLGGVDSLVSLPVETSHAAATAADRRAQGITPSLVRLAVGIETADDLVDDVARALRRV